MSIDIILGPNNWPSGPPGGMPMPGNMGGGAPMVGGMCPPGMNPAGMGMSNMGAPAMGTMSGMPSYSMGPGMCMGMGMGMSPGDPSMGVAMCGSGMGPPGMNNIAAVPNINQNMAPGMNPNMIPGMMNSSRMT